MGISTLKELKKQNPYEKFNEIAQIIEEFLLKCGKKVWSRNHSKPIWVNDKSIFHQQKSTNFEDAQTSDTEEICNFLLGND